MTTVKARERSVVVSKRSGGSSAAMLGELLISICVATLIVYGPARERLWVQRRENALGGY